MRPSNKYIVANTLRCEIERILGCPIGIKDQTSVLTFYYVSNQNVFCEIPNSYFFTMTLKSEDVGFIAHQIAQKLKIQKNPIKEKLLKLLNNL